MAAALVFPWSDSDCATLEATDNLTFMHSLRSGSINLIVTSPPYNIGKSYERRTPLKEHVRAHMSR